MYGLYSSRRFCFFPLIFFCILLISRERVFRSPDRTSRSSARSVFQAARSSERNNLFASLSFFDCPWMPLAVRAFLIFCLVNSAHCLLTAAMFLVVCLILCPVGITRRKFQTLLDSTLVGTLPAHALTDQAPGRGSLLNPERLRLPRGAWFVLSHPTSRAG